MPIKSSTYFIFNGQLSTDYGITNCIIESSLSEEFFLYPREIITTYVRGRERPYYQYKKPEIPTLDVTLFFDNGFNSDSLRNIAKLFEQPYFCPISFSDNLNKIYYVMLSGDSSLIHNGQDGYVKLKFICDSPYAYSPKYTQNYDFSTNPTFQQVIFNNEGDITLLPYLTIKKIGNGDISITQLQCNDLVEINDIFSLDDTHNFDTSDEFYTLLNYLFNLGFINKIDFSFTGLVDGEIIQVDNENEIIESSLPLTYRYDNFSNNYLRLLPGYNYLIITGTFLLYMDYNFKFL